MNRLSCSLELLVQNPLMSFGICRLDEEAILQAEPATFEMSIKCCINPQKPPRILFFSHPQTHHPSFSVCRTQAIPVVNLDFSSSFTSVVSD